MTPRPWVKRECSAVGKTQRALWSWLIRRSRWTHAVSRISCSATSSSGRSAAADSSRVRRLVSSMYPWTWSLMRLTALNACRAMPPSWHPDGQRRRPHADVPSPVAGTHAERIRLPRRPCRQHDPGRGRAGPERDPRAETHAVLDVECAETGGVRLQLHVVAGPGPARVAPAPSRVREEAAGARVIGG